MLVPEADVLPPALTLPLSHYLLDYRNLSLVPGHAATPPCFTHLLQLWAVLHRLRGLGLILGFVVGDSAPASSSKLVSEPDSTKLLVLHILPARDGPRLRHPQLTVEGVRVGNTLRPLPSFPSCCGLAFCLRPKG